MRPIHGIYFDPERNENVEECYILKFTSNPNTGETAAVAVLANGNLVYNNMCNFQVNDPSFHFPEKHSKKKSSETSS